VATAQARVKGTAGSAAVIVMTGPALVACTSLRSGSPVCGSGCTAALMVAAIFAASASAVASAAPAV
jgi:hypothetical protein